MKVHYDTIASTYDKGRAYTEAQLRLWLGEVVLHGELREGSAVLDLGCGTGRYAVPLAEQHRCFVTGLDNSAGMLRKAENKSKVRNLHWVNADGEHLSFAARTFDCCLMSMVIHHLQNKQAALDDVFRVLKPGGICLIRTVSHDQLRSVLDYRFFPRALPIDLDRIPDVPVIEDMLRRSDFSWVHTHTVISPLAESAEEYLAKIRHKHSSTLRLLSEDEYKKGLVAAEAFFANNPFPDEWKTEPISLIVARR